MCVCMYAWQLNPDDMNRSLRRRNVEKKGFAWTCKLQRARIQNGAANDWSRDASVSYDTKNKRLGWMPSWVHTRKGWEPDWWVVLWVGYGKFACAVTVISHNLTCIPPSVMLQSETEREQEAWWDGTLVNASCLSGNSLWRILSLFCVPCSVRARVRPCTDTKKLKAWRSTFISSVKFGNVAIIILVEVTTFCNYPACVWS